MRNCIPVPRKELKIIVYEGGTKSSLLMSFHAISINIKLIYTMFKLRK